jgi:hypothetical protein
MIRRALLPVLMIPAMLMVTGCGPRLTGPPKNVPIAEETTQRIFLDEGGLIRVEEDPYSRRAIRRADYDTHVTKISARVALVVEPQPNTTAAISNLLGAALVRRFQGHLAEAEALSAPRVFFIQPFLSAEATRQTGKMVVDWRLRTADGRDVGAVYAARRLTGEMRGTEPLTAFTVADAEHIAIQTAAHLLDTPAIQAAMADARILASIDETPSPAPRPKSQRVIKLIAPQDAGSVESAPPPVDKPKLP